MCVCTHTRACGCVFIRADIHEHFPKWRERGPLSLSKATTTSSWVFQKELLLGQGGCLFNKKEPVYSYLIVSDTYGSGL